jgi:hypothetical protein
MATIHAVAAGGRRFAGAAGGAAGGRSTVVLGTVGAEGACAIDVDAGAVDSVPRSGRLAEALDAVLAVEHGAHPGGGAALRRSGGRGHLPRG